MYSYQSPISRDYVLQRYTQEAIFNHIFNQEIVLKKKIYHAPYRVDENGTCFFRLIGDTILFVDFANDKQHFDCFELYEKMYKCKYVYQHIINNVKPSNIVSLLNKEGNTIKKPKKHRTSSGIAVVKQPFTKKDLDYWGKYGITKKQLIQDGVQSVAYIRIVNDDIDITYAVRNLCYAYTEWGNCIKIYQPLARKDKKWITNCKPNNIGGTHTIPNQENIDGTLIITKSYKDWRVLINANCYTIWLQNEVTLPEKLILLDYANRFDDVVILFDNDTTGITNANKLKEYINLSCARLIFSPYKNLKDSSDIFFHKGKKMLEQFLVINQVKRFKNGQSNN
jgi:hypothetical protein